MRGLSSHEEPLKTIDHPFQPIQTLSSKRLSTSQHTRIWPLLHDAPSHKEALQTIDHDSATSATCLSILHAWLYALLGRQPRPCQLQSQRKSGPSGQAATVPPNLAEHVRLLTQAQN